MYNSGEYIKECDIFLDMQYYFIDISHILAFYSQIPRHVPLHMLRHTSSKGQRSKFRFQHSVQIASNRGRIQSYSKPRIQGPERKLESVWPMKLWKHLFKRYSFMTLYDRNHALTSYWTQITVIGFFFFKYGLQCAFCYTYRATNYSFCSSKDFKICTLIEVISKLIIYHYIE